MMWHLYASGKINQCTELGCKENTMHFSTKSEAARYYRGFKRNSSQSNDPVVILTHMVDHISKLTSALNEAYDDNRFTFLNQKLREAVSEYNSLALSNGIKTLFWEEDVSNAERLISEIESGSLDVDSLRLFPVLDSVSQRYATKLEAEAEISEINEAVSMYTKTLNEKAAALKKYEKKVGKDIKDPNWVTLNSGVVRLTKRLDNVKYGATKLENKIAKLGDVSVETVVEELRNFINVINESVSLEDKSATLLS